MMKNRGVDGDSNDYRRDETNSAKYVHYRGCLRNLLSPVDRFDGLSHCK